MDVWHRGFGPTPPGPRETPHSDVWGFKKALISGGGSFKVMNKKHVGCLPSQNEPSIFKNDLLRNALNSDLGIIVYPPQNEHLHRPLKIGRNPRGKDRIFPTNPFSGCEPFRFGECSLCKGEGAWDPSYKVVKYLQETLWKTMDV